MKILIEDYECRKCGAYYDEYRPKTCKDCGSDNFRAVVFYQNCQYFSKGKTGRLRLCKVGGNFCTDCPHFTPSCQDYRQVKVAWDVLEDGVLTQKEAEYMLRVKDWPRLINFLKDNDRLASIEIDSNFEGGK